MYALNLGTRGVQEALDAHEYLNHPDGTDLSDLRRSQRRARSRTASRCSASATRWTAPGRPGHKTAHEYGRLAAETARALRSAEPGPRAGRLRQLQLGDADLRGLGGRRAGADATTRSTTSPRTRTTSRSTATWPASWPRPSTWTTSSAAWSPPRTAWRPAEEQQADQHLLRRVERLVPEPPRERWATGDDWAVAPRVIEDRYNVADAVVVGNLLISLLRHSDRVTVACQAQLVNVIAPIRTEPGGPAWRQTIFHPFAITSRLAKGSVLRTELSAPTLETETLRRRCRCWTPWQPMTRPPVR